MSKEIDIAALRKAAQEAYLQRDWAAQPMQYDKGVVGGDDDWIVHEVGSGCVARSVEKGDAQYIAAANPAVILALLDRLEQAEKETFWVSVQARVPDVEPGHFKSTHVLAFWVTRDPDEEPGGIETSWFDGRNWQGASGEMDYHGSRRVTHWMPLPAPPADAAMQGEGG